jgi:hypothetical protein
MAGNKPKTPTSKLLRFKQNRMTDVECYYSMADAVLILQAIDAVTRSGGAVMFGLTSDGGAFSFLILDGDDKVREYPHGVDELTQLLRTTVVTYSDDEPA